MNSIIEQTSNFTSPYKHHSTPNINTNNPSKSSTDIAFTRRNVRALRSHHRLAQVSRARAGRFISSSVFPRRGKRSTAGYRWSDRDGERRVNVRERLIGSWWQRGGRETFARKLDFPSREDSREQHGGERERERERVDEEGGKTSGRRSIGKVGGVSCLLDFGPNSRLRSQPLLCSCRAHRPTER